jgi:hypothetical protein
MAAFSGSIPDTLGMYVADGVTERTDCGDKVGAHPHRMAWVEIGHGRLTNPIAQPQQRCQPLVARPCKSV